MRNIALLMDHNKIKRIFLNGELNKLQSKNLNIYQPAGCLNKDEAKSVMANADIVITSWRTPPLDRDLLDQAPDLKVVVHAAGSIKAVVTPEVWKRGIRVTSSAEALAVGVGETALGLTIVSLKNIWNLARSTREKGWGEGKEKVKELFNVNVGVIGAGRAGRHYIRLLKNFDVEIFVYDPTLQADDPILQHVRHVSLEDLLRKSDVVSIHAPSVPDTYKLLNKERLALMKDEAIIINTARGTVVDEEALVEELRKGRLFACLDVTDPEPPADDHPFRTLRNVILTPHIAGAVNNGLARIGQYVSKELELFMAGKKMDGEVLPSELDTLA